MHMYANNKKIADRNVSDFFSDPAGTRTQNPQLRRLMLYPVELPDQILFSAPCCCRGHKSGAKLMLFLRLSKQLPQKPHLFCSESLSEFAQLLYHGGCGLHACGHPHGLALLEYDERGYGLHAILHGQLLVLVDVDFYHCGGVAHRLLYLFKNGVHHFARAAPCGEEVDQSGAAG